MDGIIDNLINAIQTWNEKMAEIWLLLTQSPETFKGGVIWEIIVKVHGAMLSIGLALLVLFFVFGIVKTLPEVGTSSPPIMFSRVDLPLPEVPTIATNSPCSTERFTPSRAFVIFGFVP